MLDCEGMIACEGMEKQIKSQGRGGSTRSSCEVMLACEGMAACEIMQKQINQGCGGSTGSSCEVTLACEEMLGCEIMEKTNKKPRASKQYGVVL